MCFLADSVYMTGKFILLSKIAPKFRTLLESFTPLSPNTTVDNYNFNS